MSAPVLHVRGQVLTGPEEVLEEIWVIDGVVSLTAPTSGDVETVQGYAVPGLVDAHCHVGLEAHGAVEDARAELGAQPVEAQLEGHARDDVGIRCRLGGGRRSRGRARARGGARRRGQGRGDRRG